MLGTGAVGSVGKQVGYGQWMSHALQRGSSRSLAKRISARVTSSALALLVFGPGCAASRDDGNDDSLTEVTDTDSASEGCRAESMTLVAGQGADGFVPLEHGDSILVTMGPTSPWYVNVAGLLAHTTQDVWVDARVTAIDADPPVVLGGRGAADSVALALDYYDELTCTGRFWGAQVYLDDFSGGWELICGIDGQRLELAVTVTEIVLAADDPPDARSVSSTSIGPAEVDDANLICE